MSKQPQKPSPKDAKQQKAQRLEKALRANLQRRKQGPAAKKPGAHG